MCQHNRPHFALITLKTIFVAFTLTGLGIFTLSGCGQPKETSATNTAASGNNDSKSAPPSGAPFRVALVTPGPVSDNGWNAGAYKGLQDIKSELGAEVENVEAKTEGEQKADMSAYASKGYNVVIANGGEIEDTALELESNFPKTTFVVSAGHKTGKNTQPIILLLEDGAYLEGMLAAGMSKTGHIASVGATSDASIDSVFKAFELGAKKVNPNIIVTKPSFTNDWGDVAKAKAATNALLDQGADVIMQDLDTAAQGVFQAVQLRSKQGKPVYALGTNSDQNAVAPDVILASAPIYLSKAFVPIVKQVKDGTFKPNTTPYDMKSGVIGFILNPQLESKIPADLKAKVLDAQKQITAGTLVVPKGSS